MPPRESERKFRDYRRALPNNLGKIVFLGLFLDTPQTDITDPYGRPEGETLEIVRLIEAAVHAMVRQLK
jgi:protein-tyrosine-phosphatase